MDHFDSLDRRLLNDFQRDFPWSPTPYAELARRLGTTEAEVLARLQRLHQGGTISRVGPVFRPHRLGVSTLAAMAVPEGQIDGVAALINAYPEVNHNYQREHPLNLWFVVTSQDPARLAAILAEISQRTGCAVLDLPMVEEYHIDLGFDLQWT
jgi:DNA-binding Lrp family transcriptional regulator